MPRASRAKTRCQHYLAQHTKQAGLWHEFPSYFDQSAEGLLRGSRDREERFRLSTGCPKLTGNHSYYSFLYKMLDGEMEGMFLMGQNPAVGAQNARLERKALAKLKWLVVRDLVEIESASFWYDSPEIERGELKTERDRDRSFLFPGRRSRRKGRRLHQHAAPPAVARESGRTAGRLRSEGWFMHQLAKRLIAKAQASDDPTTSRCARSTGGIRRTPERRTGDGSGPRGNQRLENKANVGGAFAPRCPAAIRSGYKGPSHIGPAPSRRAARQIPGTERRRHDRKRLLDLLRRLWQRRREQGASPPA